MLVAGELGVDAELEVEDDTDDVTSSTTPTKHLTIPGSKGVLLSTDHRKSLAAAAVVAVAAVAAARLIPNSSASEIRVGKRQAG